jgi:hypothetical protein
MADLETRVYAAELRAEGDGKTVTGIVAPYYRPADIPGRFTETFGPTSLTPVNPCFLFAGHPSGEPDDEMSMPASMPGRFAEGTVDGITGMLGRWRAAGNALGEHLLEGIRSGRAADLSAGFLPNAAADSWSADRKQVERRGCSLLHVAAVGRGAHPGAKVLELRASSLSTDERKRLAKLGHALPDGSYPVPDREHLHAAAVLAASRHGDFEAARRLIRKRAKELGVDVTTLPGFGAGSSGDTESRRWTCAQRLVEARHLVPGLPPGGVTVTGAQAKVAGWAQQDRLTRQKRLIQLRYRWEEIDRRAQLSPGGPE